MLGPQRISPIYPVHRFNNPLQGTVPFRNTLLDVNWSRAWPVITSILLGCIMLITSAAIVGLDIANLAIEGKKKNHDIVSFGEGTAKVGAGIWSGSISFLAGISIIVISMYFSFKFTEIFFISFYLVFVKDRRVAATLALIAVTIAFFFTIVLIGLTANAVQIHQYPLYNGDLDSTQYKLVISILSLAAFILTLCITYFIMYISVFFSSDTRRPAKY